MEKKFRSIASGNALKTFIIGLVAAVVGLAIIAVAVAPYFYRLLTGPYTITTQDVLEAKPDLFSTYYNVEVNGSELFDTGFYGETKLYGLITLNQTNYGALAIGDRLLLVEVTGDLDFTKTTYAGTLDTITSEERMQILEDLYREFPDLRGVFADVALRATSPLEAILMYGFFGAIALGLVIYGANRILASLSWLANLENEPSMRKLKRYGQEISKVFKAVESDQAAGVTKLAKADLSRRWLVNKQGSAFDIMALDHLVWVYPYVETTKSYGIVTSRKHSVMLCDKHGIATKVPVKKQADVEPFMLEIQKKTPWALFGHTDRAADVFRRDLASFNREIEARHQQYLAEQGAPA